MCAKKKLTVVIMIDNVDNVDNNDKSDNCSSAARNRSWAFADKIRHFKVVTSDFLMTSRKKYCFDKYLL